MNEKKQISLNVSLLDIIKLFMIIFLPLTVSMSSIAVSIYYVEVNNRRSIIGTNEAHHIHMLPKSIISDFESVVSDLMILSEQHELQRMLENVEGDHRNDLADTFLTFSKRKRLYDQIRFLDETGMEVVRINFNSGNPYIVPEDQLQFKGDRYYFENAIRLEKEDVYFSPFDLNIEKGEIEQPLTPVIRVGTPVFDSHGLKRGIVILNYLGEKLLNDLEYTYIDSGQVMLLNSDGFLLIGPKPEDEWGFMYEDGSNRMFGNFFPQAWRRISSAESGQFYNSNGMFTFTTVYPILESWKSITNPDRTFEHKTYRQEIKKYYWKIVSHVSPDILNAVSRQVLKKYIFASVIPILVMAIGSWILASIILSRKRAQKELEWSLSETQVAMDKIDGILKSVADGLIVTDLHNNVILMNRAAEDLLGVRLSEVIDRPIDFAIEEKTLREKLIDTLGKKKTGYQFDFELPGNDPDHPRIMRARTSVIHDREGGETGIVTIIYDVTHEREIDRMKTEFISTAAHELRTPLTSIQGFSEILQTREDLGEEEKKKFLSYINNQSLALAQIINDFLDISRLESGRGFSLEKAPCKTGDIIKQVIPYFQEHAPKHRFEVVLPDEPVELTVDKDKVEKVLKNILSNAVKYSPEGGLIRVTGEILEDCYRVSVEDRGIGMTPEQVEKIFDKFYRADFSDAAVEGTGLGMSIVKYIVEAHGGKVWVESELGGKGTTVRFTLPW